MKYEIVYLPLVYEDIKETSSFYNSRQSGLGKEFVTSVKSEFKRISKNPLLFEVKYNNTRIAYTERFPFGIHFEIQKEIHRIVVKGVYHTARNAKIWYER